MFNRDYTITNLKEDGFNEEFIKKLPTRILDRMYRIWRSGDTGEDYDGDFETVSVDNAYDRVEMVLKYLATFRPQFRYKGYTVVFNKDIMKTKWEV